jgi:hypothetical protein
VVVRSGDGVASAGAASVVAAARAAVVVRELGLAARAAGPAAVRAAGPAAARAAVTTVVPASAAGAAVAAIASSASTAGAAVVVELAVVVAAVPVDGVTPTFAWPRVPAKPSAAGMSSAPAFAPVTARSVFVSSHFTWSGVYSGCFPRISAATPLAIGAAKDVPDSSM